MNIILLTQIYLLQFTHTLSSFLFNLHKEKENKHWENAKPSRFLTIQGVF